MATTARREIFKMVAQRVDPHHFFGTNTGTASTGIVDTSLKAYADADDGIVSVWVTILETTDNAAPEDEITRALSSSAYTASSGTLAVEPDFSAAMNSGDTYMLTTVDPNTIGYEIDRAIRTLFPALYQPVIDESIAIDNLLTNSDFETFSGGAFTGWTLVSAPTVTQETTRVIHGSSSAKVVAGGTGGGIVQTLTNSVNTEGIVGKMILYKAWSHTGAGGQARIGVSFNGTSYTYSDYHNGEDEWELLSVEATIPTDMSALSVICEVTANDTAYFDAAWAAISPLYKYTLPTTIEHGPFAVSQQYSESRVDGLYYPLAINNRAKRGRRLRIEGMGRLSTPSTMGGTVEVDQSRAELIAVTAAMNLVRNVDPELYGQLAGERLELLDSRGIKMTTPTAQIPEGFRYEEDSSGRYLIIEDR
jgi:hypothetical protein